MNKFTSIQIRRIIKNLVMHDGPRDTREIEKLLEKIGVSRAAAWANIRWFRDYYTSIHGQRADLDILVPCQRTLATYG